MRKIKYIVIHCTSGPALQTTKAIKDYWRNSLGWKQVGYHFIVNADGTVENLAPIEAVTNGVKNFNSVSVHICYKGGVGSKDTRTPEQKESILKTIKKVLEELKQHQPIDGIKIRGHRDFSPDQNGNGKVDFFEWIKDCPCFDAKGEYQYLQGAKATNDKSLP